MGNTVQTPVNGVSLPSIPSQRDGSDERIPATVAQLVSFIAAASDPQAMAAQVLEGLARTQASAEVAGGARTVTTSVRGVPVPVPCPAWCTGTCAEPVTHIEDVRHYGERFTLPLSMLMGAEEPLTVFLAQWPFANDADQGRPYLAVDTDGEVASYHRTAGLALADQLVAFAADVRRLARMLPEVQA